MNTASPDHPSGRLRVSDADRDGALAELSTHFQAGRLTADEFEERAGQALAARAAADLAVLFTDLPRQQQALTSPARGAPASAPASAGPSWPARLPRAPLIIFAVVAVIALLSHPFHVTWLAVLAILAVRLLIAGRRRIR
jgi:hypothetical protein